MINEVLYCHPESLKLLREQLRPHDPLGGPLDSFMGTPIHVSELVPKSRKTGCVTFPNDRLVEYGPEDHQWAIALGFAHEETEPVVYRVAPGSMMFSGRHLHLPEIVQ